MNFYEKSLEKWNSIAMPLGSLGVLQDNVSKICQIQQTLTPNISKKCVAVFCADNGIVAQNVTQSGQEVTTIVANNMCAGQSAMCKMAEIAKVDVFPIDIGINSCEVNEKVLKKRIMNGTNDFSQQKAMSSEQVWAAIEVGINFVSENLKYDVFAIGEMGIGNTTTSSAVASVMLGLPVAQVTDKGAGLSSEGITNKVSVIEKAIAKHCPNKEDAIDVLSKVGGLDICGMIGVMIGCEKYRKVCILDGFITLVAYICAEKINSEISDFVIASHISSYKFSDNMLEKYNLQPIINAKMRLGEGSGAVALVPILDMAVKIFNEMPLFSETKITQYEQL